MAPSPANLIGSGAAEMNELAQLAQLIHFRNKNQHRRSHWWRHFSTFRRQLLRVLTELEKPHSESPRIILNPGNEVIGALHQATLDAWTDIYVAKWYRAFSQIVAERQFAQIGVVLLVTLGKACSILGITEALQERGQEELERALLEYSKREEAVSSNLLSITGDDHDLGMVIERENAGHVEATRSRNRSGDPRLQGRPKRKQEESPKKLSTAKRRRKKNGNAIDDIFGDLE
jgi:ribonuclease MRP protein subunit RMP1